MEKGKASNQKDYKTQMVSPNSSSKGNAKQEFTGEAISITAIASLLGT